MASEYDALLTADEPKSEYDALLNATEPRREEIKTPTAADAPYRFVASAGRLTDALFAPGEATQHPIISPEVAKFGTDLAATPARLVASGLEKITGRPYSRSEKGIEQGIASTASGFSLENLASLPAFAVPGVAETFAANVLAKLPEQYGGVKDAIQQHGLFSAETAKAFTDAGIQDVTALLGLKGAGVARGMMREDFTKPSLTDTLFPTEKPPAPDIPIQPEEVKTNAEQITKAAQPDGMRVEPEVPTQIEKPAVAESGPGVPAGGQGPEVPQEVAPSAAHETFTPEQAAQPEAVRGGVVPAERVTQGSADPEIARQMSPQALGVTHPLPAFIKNIADYFVNNSPSQMWNTIKGSLDASLGKTFAKTTIADRESGEAAARWISAKIAAPHLADTFSTQVLDGTGVDPVKFGAALTEDNLRSVRAAAETPEAKAAVTTIIGAKGSPFKTEGDYKAFLSDPATQQAIERHRALWAETVEPMFRKAQLLDPSEPLPGRGEETGARINLYNDTEGTGKDVVSGTGKGNLTATFRKKSPFAIQAKGSGQSYNINYVDQMRNTFGRQLEISAKNDFETKLVDSGNAVIGKPGETPTLPDGEKTVAFPLKRSTIITAEDGSKVPVNQNIYVRKSLGAEYRNAANVDRYDVPAVVKAFADAANKSALAGLTDASVHGLNLMTALFTRPSIVGSVLSDSLLSTFGRADVPVTIAKVFTKALQDNKAQVADLSAIGAMKGDYPTRNPLGNFIKVADKSTRLVLDDAFKKMADAGLVENTETNRREFVNQVGQYNLKAQGGLRRIARETGIGPFATAGTTFNTLGVRTATMSPGVTATSPMAAAALRANVLSKWIGASVLVGSLNYLLTKDKGGGVMGRPGVPIGKIDTGMDDQNGRPLSLPVFDLLGLGRAMRVTGVRGLIESQKKGLNLQTSIDGSVRDIANSSISPFAGPVVRFGTEATTGFQPAINVGRATHVSAPGENQFAQNVKDALIDANPVLKSLALAREPGGTVADAARQQFPRMSLQPSQRPEFIEKYPEIVHKAQASAFMDDVVRRARNMKPEARTQFVNDSLDKLSDEDRAHAVKTLKYRKIEY